jgi:hypothetical protein
MKSWLYQLNHEQSKSRPREAALYAMLMLTLRLNEGRQDSVSSGEEGCDVGENNNAVTKARRSVFTNGHCIPKIINV